jgi:hypothetical protein
MNKELLVEEIISVLCGEVLPSARSKKGAPVKNEYVDPEIPQKIEKYCCKLEAGVLQ